MWQEYKRAVSIEEETVGESKKKNVLWSDGMKEENKNEGKLRKAFSNRGCTPFIATYGVTLIFLFSSKQHCNQES